MAGSVLETGFDPRVAQRLKQALSKVVKVQGKTEEKLYINIPKDYARILGLRKGSRVRVILDPRGRLIIEPVEPLD